MNFERPFPFWVGKPNILRLTRKKMENDESWEQVLLRTHTPRRRSTGPPRALCVSFGETFCEEPVRIRISRFATEKFACIFLIHLPEWRSAGISTHHLAPT